MVRPHSRSGTCDGGSESFAPLSRGRRPKARGPPGLLRAAQLLAEPDRRRLHGRVLRRLPRPCRFDRRTPAQQRHWRRPPHRLLRSGLHRLRSDGRLFQHVDHQSCREARDGALETRAPFAAPYLGHDGGGLGQCADHLRGSSGSRVVDRAVRLKNASSDLIREVARKSGMKTLADDGWRLVRMGVTTVEEVLSVTTAKEVERTTRKATADTAEKEATPASTALSR